MAITIELWEDTGAITSGHGTTRTQITSLGFKDSNLPESTHFVYYPIQRPDSGTENSYSRYLYFKIYGTYPAATRVRLVIGGDIEGSSLPYQETTDEVEFHYNLTDTYAVPSKTDIGGTAYNFASPEDLFPNLSTTGPEDASSALQYLATNTTYYTEYLECQVQVKPNDWNKYGNTGIFTLKLYFHEYESTDY